jgi:hypothetical protein
MKIVVFDLDETLGYFSEMGIFWDSLQRYLDSNNVSAYRLTQEDFNDILDLFPEFVRPNIISILNYLKNKKETNCCHKLMIYTNNTGPREWSENIKSYFESKIHYKLIDQVIAAFKINGKNVELCRTTYDKTHKDFIRCTKIPDDTEICFIDDTFYPKMTNENVYYINLKPYYYDLSFEYMIETFEKSDIGKKLIGGSNMDKDNKDNKNNKDNIDKDKDKEKNTLFRDFMLNEFKKYSYEYKPKSPAEYEIDKILGKHILTHLQTFFNDKRTNTKRRRIKTKYNKTKRRY